MSSTKMMMMSFNRAKFAADRYSVSSTFSDRSFDHESRPSTACSSTDMCTPMPNSTFRNSDSKSFSTASECSFTSAPYLCIASDAESVDSPAHKPAQPATPPSLSARNHHRDVCQNRSIDDPFHASLQSWQIGDCFNPANNEPWEADNLSHSPAEQPPTHNPIAWDSQPATQLLPYDYQRYANAFMDQASGYSRSASYQSTASIDSWNSRGQVDSSLPLPGYSSGLAASMSQLNLNPLANYPLSGMGVYPAKPDGINSGDLAGPHPARHSATRASSADQTRNIVSSLASLTAAYQATPLGYGAKPIMDPQPLMTYTAAFYTSPRLDIHGFTPELLAARANALAQIANGGDMNPAAPSQNSGDHGPSPTNKKTNLYKTELCRSWEEKGTCRYGSKCQFAHGQDQLKNVSRHPKFKTEICRTFWLHGSCPYGKRCCFLHTTPTESGVPAAPSLNDPKEASQIGRNAHDPPTSRLQQRLSSGISSVNGACNKTFGDSLCGYLSSSPQLQSAPPTRCPSDIGDMEHSRSNSSSSCSLSSDDSPYHGRIHIGFRFGAREHVPPQDAPAPRSRLERLRPTGDYLESTSSMPSTSTATTTRYSPFLDRHQPLRSAFSDSLTRSPLHHISKARSAHGDGDSQWPSSRLSASPNALG